MRPDYSYQIPLIKETFENLIKHKIALLAACPGAGKTNMGIKIIEEFHRKFPDKIILILTHGQLILRSQFQDRMEEISDLSVSLISHYSQLGKHQIQIALPQTIANAYSFPKVGLIIVDEAHQFYSAKMVQEIIKKTKCEYQLLLTGTPSLILQKVPLSAVSSISLSDLIEKDILEDVSVKLNKIQIESKSFFDAYNQSTMEITRSAFNKVSITSILGKVLKKIDSNFKSMIICNNQDQAKEIFEYLDKKKISSHLSISELKDTVDFSNFKTDSDVNFLIVVNRGILGFDFPELRYILDFSFSLNRERNFQALCRLVRKSAHGQRKVFFKLCVEDFYEETCFIMDSVCYMAEKEGYLSFEGISRLSNEKIEKIVNREKGVFKEEDFNLKSKDIKEGKVLSFLDFKALANKPSTLSCLAKAKSCKTVREFQAQYPREHKFMTRTVEYRKMMNDHFGSGRILWDEPKVIEFLKSNQFKSVEALRRSSRGCGCYDWILRNNRHIIVDFFGIGKYLYMDKGELISIIKQKKYKNRESLKNNPKLIYALKKKGLRDEIFDEIFGPKEPSINRISKEQAISILNQFETRTEFDASAKYVAKIVREKYPSLLDEILPKRVNQFG